MTNTCLVARDGGSPYASDGLLDSVTDGLGHVTAYDYDGAFRLTAITDAVSFLLRLPACDSPH